MSLHQFHQYQKPKYPVKFYRILVSGTSLDLFKALSSYNYVRNDVYCMRKQLVKSVSSLSIYIYTKLYLFKARSSYSYVRNDVYHAQTIVVKSVSYIYIYIYIYISGVRSSVQWVKPNMAANGALGYVSLPHRNNRHRMRAPISCQLKFVATKWRIFKGKIRSPQDILCKSKR